MLQEDLSVFFDVDEFAVVAKITTATFTRSLNVIFDQIFDPIAMRPMFDYVYERSGMRAEARNLMALCKTSEIADVHHRDTILIENKTYTIVGVNPTQDGAVTILTLEE
jgi:hypothetical protein